MATEMKSIVTVGKYFAENSLGNLLLKLCMLWSHMRISLSLSLSLPLSVIMRITRKWKYAHVEAVWSILPYVGRWEKLHPFWVNNRPSTLRRLVINHLLLDQYKYIVYASYHYYYYYYYYFMCVCVCVLWRHRIWGNGWKICRRVDLRLGIFLTSALDGDEWWTSRAGRLHPGRESPVPSRYGPTKLD